MARFDMIIIGSGPAGSAAAEAAREAGAAKVAVIESAERLGGECPNWGCVPTKALLRSAEVYALMTRAEEFGLDPVEPTFDFAKVAKRRQDIVDSLTTGGRLETYFENLGVTVIRGRATFVAEDAVEVEGERYEADRFIVCAGATAVNPPIEGLADVGALTSDDLIGATTVPDSLAIIGGGPIGVEFAQIFSTFGSEVTIIEYAPHVLSREDEEIAAVVAEAFTKRGVTIHASSKAAAARKDGDDVVIDVVPASGEGEATEVRATTLLVATGKRPALAGLGLDAAGVELDARGAPKLDGTLKSTNPRIRFAGDCAGQMLFTHVAHEMGTIAAKNAMKDGEEEIDLRVVPRGTFCVPEVGSVGITEKAARDAGHDVAVGSYPYRGVGKARVTGEDEGLVKIVVDRKTGMLLGGHVVGHAAAELVHELALAMFAEVHYRKIADMIHAYPTFAEAVGVAAYAVG